MNDVISAKQNWTMLTLLVFALMVIPATAQTAGHGGITDEQINAFARAQNQAAQIQLKYNDMLVAAEDDMQRQNIAQKANDEMVEAIQAEGLSVEQYNNILTEVQGDPELMERVSNAIQALQ